MKPVSNDIARGPAGPAGFRNVEAVITDPEPLRVLLVEDNPGDARLVREMLAEMNTERYEVIATDRLADTLAALTERPFDAILLDLNLPDDYGLATLIKVRAVAPHVPVIVVSGLADEEMAIHALREGAYTYLVKGQMNGYLLNRSIRYSIERMRSEQIQQTAAGAGVRREHRRHDPRGADRARQPPPDRLGEPRVLRDLPDGPREDRGTVHPRASPTRSGTSPSSWPCSSGSCCTRTSRRGSNSTTSSRSSAAA